VRHTVASKGLQSGAVNTKGELAIANGQYASDVV
jgi:hypothetical protein